MDTPFKQLFVNTKFQMLHSNFNNFIKLFKRIRLSRILILKATCNIPRVLLYHRFTSAYQKTMHRIGADVFRWQLEQITKKFRVISFSDCLDFFYQNHQWPKRSAVITVDDGYRDFYQYAYPQLKALSLPATFFVTVNFIDKKIWLWPDRIDYILRTTTKSKFSFQVNGKTYKIRLDTTDDRFFAWKLLSDTCILAVDNERKRIIEEVETDLDVVIPEIPSDEYSSVSWEELREMANNRIEIGCHTMNHPILSKIPLYQLREEIVQSRNVLERNLQKKIHTFCYPNGQPGDINESVISAVKEAEYLGSPYWFDLLKWDPFLVPRIGVSEDKEEFLDKISGFEFAGQKWRSLTGRLRQ